MARRTSKEAEATRRDLIRAGRRLFAKRGFAAVSAEEIVAAAGVTRGALYHHFDGKERLFAAVLEDVMREIHGRLGVAAAGAAAPLEGLTRGVRMFLDTCTDATYRQILLVDGPAVVGWHTWRDMDLEYGLGLLRRALHAAVAAGELRIDDVDTASHLIGGALVDGAMLIGRDPKDRALRRRVEETTLRLIGGLAR